MSNAITPVGFATSFWNPYAQGLKTFPVNPTAVGDLLVVVTNIGDTHGAHATALSGGGVTVWQHLCGPVKSTGASYDLWMGVVTTAGPSTVTVTIAGTSFVNVYEAQQFTGGLTWAVDHAGSKSNAAASVITYPTLVPSGSNELYVGFGVSLLGPALGSQPAGYAMPLSGFLFNPSVSTSQTPVCANPTTNASWALGALITAS